MPLMDAIGTRRGTGFYKKWEKKGRDAYGETFGTGGIINRRDVPGGIRRGRTLEDPAWGYAEAGEVIPAGNL